MKTKISIEDMNTLAKNKNGKCLSKVYEGSFTKLFWQCEKGHRWESAPLNIKRGKWCPKCAGNVRYTIEKMQETAKKRKGKCLSKTYINNQTKLLWECHKGHQWEATSSDVMKGSWCHVCKGGNPKKKLTIELMRELANKKNGKCLSTEYKGIFTKLNWECEFGHIWETAPAHIKRGTWCPKCSGTVIKPKGSIEEMQELAALKGGKCLSKKYVNSKTKLLWECADKHTWDATSNTIKRGHWCPHCNFYISEEKTRFIFQTLLKKPFKKTRKILGEGWELDGYNKDLKVAFEHNGVQHYKYHSVFHSSKQDFLNQQKRDKEKLEKCKQLGIQMITVPYWISKSDKLLLDFIRAELSVLNIPYDHTTIDFSSFYTNLSIIKELNEIAKKENGHLLSDSFYGFHSKLLWKCKQGHEWNASASNIKKGSWCPKCERNQPSMEELREIARKRGGKCISVRYSGKEMEWECGLNHQWSARPYDIKNGTWCPHCAYNKKDYLSKMKEIATSRKGECISDTYINIRTALKWQCEKGHKWEATPKSIKKGTWCPYCSNKAPINLEEMKELAKKFQGKCLSEGYHGYQSKLLWECKEGHQWTEKPLTIKKGIWCSECGENKESVVHKKKNKFTLEEMQDLAKKHRGVCVSDSYINANTYMIWKCEIGHEFSRRPMEIIYKNRWCPDCKNLKKETH